jgi:hypothetical protein
MKPDGLSSIFGGSQLDSQPKVAHLHRFLVKKYIVEFHITVGDAERG